MSKIENKDLKEKDIKMDLQLRITEIAGTKDIPLLTPSQLRAIWKELFFNESKFLCKEYSLNENKFHKFIEGTRHSNAAVEAIQLFLAEKCGVEMDNPQTKFKNVREICEEIQKRASKYIIIIDGDNSSHALNDLNWLFPKDSKDVLVIFGISNSRIPSVVLELKKVSWLTLLSSHSKIKNALDHVITFLIGMIHSFCPLLVPIILMSHDEFINIITTELKSQGRPSYCFDIWQEHVIELLKIFPIKILSDEARSLVKFISGENIENTSPQALKYLEQWKNKKTMKPEVKIYNINPESYDILDKLREILKERGSILLSILGQELPIREKDNLPRSWKKALSTEVLKYIGATLEGADTRVPSLHLIDK